MRKKRYHQGFFKPKNPSKYKGDPTQIVYRSSWELKCLINLDAHEDVLAYSSEEIVIPYRSKIDGKMHRYFVDFWVRRKFPDGSIREFIIEVKPNCQTIPPQKPKKITKNYVEAVKTYGVNTSKWEAAREYCRKKGMEFQILTEKNLF